MEIMNAILITHTSHLWLFSLMVLGIIALPGMDMAYVLASTLAGGRKLGMAAVMGIVAGGASHVLMAALGVGLLLSIYPVAFNALLVLGSIYIVYIGWCLWRGAGALGEVSKLQVRSEWQTFWRGAATCLMNPKAYVFMVAVFPQFVRPAYGSLTTQAIAMGLIIATIQFMVYGGMAWGTGGLQNWLNHNRTTQVMIGRGVGVLLIFAAALTGVHGWRHVA